MERKDAAYLLMGLKSFPGINRQDEEAINLAVEALGKVPKPEPKGNLIDRIADRVVDKIAEKLLEEVGE